MNTTKREYFYKNEKGQLKTYLYCSLCSAGPFKEELENREIFTFGNNTSLRYCIPCMRLHHIKSGGVIPELLKNEEVKNEGIKDIVIINEPKDEDIANIENEIDIDGGTFLEKDKKEPFKISDKPFIKQPEPIEPEIEPELEPESELVVEPEIKSELVEPVEIIQDQQNYYTDYFNSMSARNIIQLVKEKTGELITISEKSKSSVVKKAVNIFISKSIPIEKIEFKIEKKPIKVKEIKVKEVKTDKADDYQLPFLIVKPEPPFLFVKSEPSVKSEPDSNFNKYIEYFNPMSARVIIQLVKEKTGELITISEKSKSSVVKKAANIFISNSIQIPS